MKYSWLLLIVILISCNHKSEQARKSVSATQNDPIDTIKIKGGIGVNKKTGGVITVVDTFILLNNNSSLNDTQIDDKIGRYSTKTKDYIVRWDTIK